MVIPRDRPSFSNRSIEHDVLPFSWQHGIGVLAWSPRASGFLVDSFDLQSLDPQDFRRRHPYAQEPAYTKLIRVRKMLQDIAQDHHKRLIDLSIAWGLRNPALTGAIIGIRNEQEAMEMIGGVNWELTEQELGAVEDALADWS